MNENPHFATANSWKAARTMLTFAPLVPTHTAGLRLQALRIHVRDHKMRDLREAIPISTIRSDLLKDAAAISL